MSTSPRIKDCIDNHEKYVAKLTTMPDKELAKKLHLIDIQSQIAEKARKTESLELMEIWRAQIIEARILKAENNIPDAPNEMEIVLAENDARIKKDAKRRERLIEKKHSPVNDKLNLTTRNKNKTSSEPKQLALF